MRPELTGTPAAAFGEALSRAMDFKPPRFDAEFAAMDAEADKLRTWLGERGSTKPPQDASRAALRDFVRIQDLPTLRQATLVSFGCTDPFDDRRHGLVADSELFRVFLDRVDDYRETPRALRHCYRGLLHAYFEFDAERGPACVRENLALLRTYLAKRSSLVATTGFLPPWVETLQRNPEVLGPDPGAFYGSELFRGRSERFEEVRTELGITDASWLVWRVVVGQIEAATRGPDAEFRSAIPGMLDLLTRHPLAKNFGLAKVLARYRACASPALHQGLRDFAVEAWGNPWLALNEAKWSVVAPEARKMVAEWLKLALMQKFFGLLADDGLNDTRRLKFWEAYHESIHAMYFALGETARTHPGPDFREVRKQMEGLRLTLTHSTPRNNAFIMCIGEHVIVEFGEKGNACFIFHKDRLPFALVGEVAGNSDELKHTRRLERLVHLDRGLAQWEDKFREVLSSVVRVQAPDPVRGASVDRSRQPQIDVSKPRPAAAAAVIRPPVQRAPSELTEAQSRLKVWLAQPFTMTEFEHFCRTNHLDWKDYREIGGTLKVFTKQQGTAVAAQLETWGFRFKNTVGWWYQ
jgi:hypothetical protein